MAPDTRAIALRGDATINRRDFDVNFDRTLENGSFVIGNKVELELAVEASAQA